MITVENRLFILETERTAYCFRAREDGVLEHLYYGARLGRREDYEALAPVYRHQPGNAVVLESGAALERMDQEVGTAGWGDSRECAVDVIFPDGDSSASFRYFHTMRPELDTPAGLPAAAGEGETLQVVCKDARHEVYLNLYYTVFPETDAIVRWARLSNDTDGTVTIRRLMSQQIDLPRGDYLLHTFRGAWAREMDHITAPVTGRQTWGARVGVSSSRCNPFAMVSAADATERFGAVWGLNLLYSGNHLGVAERGPFGGVRVVQGVDGLTWHLAAGESFDTPQAVSVFSVSGFGGMSVQMHRFVRRHIVRGEWQYRERPVLVNSWEAMYFKVDRRKLLALGKEAKALGAELLVLDDGWFRGRKDDTAALGDWQEDTGKLPGGLGGLCKDVQALGLDFGLWMEPEMVSEKSDLFRDHPDWILGHADQALGRNQYVLDLIRADVCDYVYQAVADVLSSADISYIKWDMNRIFSDTWSSTAAPERQGEVCHRYVLGLYSILRRLNAAFSHVLFEACASGGNRTDLGMLCFMPQVWASDNTDVLCRANIQNGYSYGYPQSVLGCHVSASPNHQTLRRSPLDSRLQVACFGLLGFELDLGDLPKGQRESLKQQVAFYKAHRRTLQFGQLYRGNVSENETVWTAAATDGSEALTLHFCALNGPNEPMRRVRCGGLTPDALYHVTNLPVTPHLHDFGSLVNMMSPVPIKPDSLTAQLAEHFVKLECDSIDLTASGLGLMRQGFVPVQHFSGTGYDGGTAVMRDFDSRLYLLERQEEPQAAPAAEEK